MPKTQGRGDEPPHPTSDPFAVTERAVLRELARIAFANLLDCVRIGKDGDVTIDVAQIDRDKAVAVQEIVIDTTVDGRGEAAKTVRRVRFKLGDKRAALVELGKHLGLFSPRRDATPGDDEPSDADLEARANDIIQALRDAGLEIRSGGGSGGDKSEGRQPVDAD